jgi:hypothetical protein
MKAKSLDLTQQEYKVLFSGVLTFFYQMRLDIETIILTNKLLFEKLQVSHGEGSKGIGNVFFTMAAYLKCYSPFIYNLKNSQQLINDLNTRNNKFSKFIAEAAKDPRCRGNINKCTIYMYIGYNINTYLVLPVQRIPRYELLLKELIKYTPPNFVSSGPDDIDYPLEHQQLLTALDKIKELCIAVDDAKRHVDDAQRVVQVI